MVAGGGNQTLGLDGLGDLAGEVEREGNGLFHEEGETGVDSGQLQLAVGKRWDTYVDSVQASLGEHGLEVGVDLGLELAWLRAAGPRRLVLLAVDAAHGHFTALTVHVIEGHHLGFRDAHQIDEVRIPEAEVVALYDVDRERCEVAMRRINGQQDQAARPGGPEPRKLQAKVYTDYKAMLTEAGLHAVYICVPPFAHGDLELAAIDAGLALFVEKPVALSLDLARQVTQGIEAKSLVSASGYQTRYSEATDRAKELIGNKTIGMALGFYLGGLPGTPWWRVQAQSGGQLVEQATHTVDLMRYLVGDVTKVYAAGALRLLKDTPNYDIFDVATTTLHFTSGAIGTVSNLSLIHI